MSQGSTDAIRTTILNHYNNKDNVLLLSELGKLLREQDHWPSQEDQRSLVKVVEELQPEIIIVRDPEAVAYVVVVPAAKKCLAEQAIEGRRCSNFLAKLPRSVLLAFCLRKMDDQSIFVQLAPPFRYHVGQCPGSGFVVIDEQFRSPGLYINDPAALSLDQTTDLVIKIENWARQNNIQLADLFGERQDRRPAMATSSRPTGSTKNALERLYEAQSLSLREKIVMPFDIAVYLSRIP